MLPLRCDEMDIGKCKGSGEGKISCGDWVIIPGVREAIASGAESFDGYLYHSENGRLTKHTFNVGTLTDDERKIILAGSLTGRALEEKEENK